MARPSLASRGWESHRVRVALPRWVWAELGRTARLGKAPIARDIWERILAGIAHVPDLEPDPAGDALREQSTAPVPDPDGQMYEQTSLDSLGLPEG